MHLNGLRISGKVRNPLLMMPALVRRTVLPPLQMFAFETCIL